VEKEKQIETYKQKNIQLEEKLSIMNRYVEESKRKENSNSIFDSIPDTHQFNKLKDEIKILEVIIYILLYIIFLLIILLLLILVN